MNDYEDLIFLFKERSKLIKYLYEIDGEITSLCNYEIFYEDNESNTTLYDNDFYKKRFGKLSKAEYLRNLETKNTKNVKKIKNVRRQKEYSKSRTFNMLAKRYYKSSIL